MWIKRDLAAFLQNCQEELLPIKILRGPRQTGKTSLLDSLKTHQLVPFDDLGIRRLAQENPSLFFQQFSGALILDEATLAPNIFLELKLKVDQERRAHMDNMDIWITGSNQTLLNRAVQESLAGRANYFLLNTLSLHESCQFDLGNIFLCGGWPELYATEGLSPVRYLNDFIATFIERDIVVAAGIEKKAAFSKTLQLVAARVAELINYSDIAKNVGVDTTTVQSWIALLEQNGILSILQPYYSNLNQRLIKTPKIYIEDVGLAARLQGWSESQPLLLSPYFGHLLENLAFIEITRFFTNRGLEPQIFFVRSKDQVEVDFLIQLSNQRFLAIEVKATPTDFTSKQIQLLDSLQLDIVERWMVAPTRSGYFLKTRLVLLQEIYACLGKIGV